MKICLLLLWIVQSSAPPVEKGEFRKPDLVEITGHEPGIRLDIRYATTNNFLHRQFYTQPRAFLQQPAATALFAAARQLRSEGYGLLIFDGYRPWSVTKMFWDNVTEENKKFVADPAKGSRHNRGCAVDLTLYDLKTGKPVDMPSGYDEMSERAFPNYTGGTPEETRKRDLLRRVMEANGFTVYEFEWWHYDYKDWRDYAIGNEPFPALK